MIPRSWAVITWIICACWMLLKGEAQMAEDRNSVVLRSPSSHWCALVCTASKGSSFKSPSNGNRRNFSFLRGAQWLQEWDFSVPGFVWVVLGRGRACRVSLLLHLCTHCQPPPSALPAFFSERNLGKEPLLSAHSIKPHCSHGSGLLSLEMLRSILSPSFLFCS